MKTLQPTLFSELKNTYTLPSEKGGALYYLDCASKKVKNLVVLDKSR
jgi:hypothetical protein